MAVVLILGGISVSVFKFPTFFGSVSFHQFPRSTVCTRVRKHLELLDFGYVVIF